MTEMEQATAVIEIPLRRRDGTIRAYALIDGEDGALAELRWSLGYRNMVGRNYWRGRRCFRVYLHREVLGLVMGDGLEGDHINGDPLDNRRSNLRVTTHAQNLQNVPARGGSSRHRGVYWDAHHRKWRAVVGRRHVGRFDTEDEAAAAARAARNLRMTHNNEARSAL